MKFKQFKYHFKYEERTELGEQCCGLEAAGSSPGCDRESNWCKTIVKSFM